ncbi:MAG: type sorting protein [Ferruginibacter sp.]|nr:type sorting protein [Ferruginibacter sp.]
MEQIYHLQQNNIKGSKSAYFFSNGIVGLFFYSFLFLLQVWPIHKVDAQNLDLLGLSSTAPSAAYSLRKVNSAYTGQAIRVKRSTDSAEVDVAFDGRNEVSALSTVKFKPGIALVNTSSFFKPGGALDVTAGSAVVTGTMTTFTTELSVGDILVDINTKTTIGIVSVITDDTHLVLEANALTSATGQFRAANSMTFGDFFVGAKCYLHTWYDQSGNSKNVVSSLSGAYQAIVVEGDTLKKVNGKAAIIWQGSSITQYLVCSSSTTVQTVNAVRMLYSTGSSAYQTLFAMPAHADFSIRAGYGNGPNTADWVYGTGVPPTNWVNGVQTMTGNTTLHTLTSSATSPFNNNFSISSNISSNTRGLKNNDCVSELILFAGTLSASEKGLLECNQSFYFSINNSAQLIISNQAVTSCSASTFSSTPGASNVTYTWGAPVISPINSITGGSAQTSGVFAVSEALTNITANPATATYTVTPSLCGVSGATFTVTVTVNPLPAVPVISTNYCTGNGFVTLTSSAGSAYLWSTGQTTQVININNAGTYSVSTSTSTHGCAANASITVAQELVPNGNFSSGNTGFTTAYIYNFNNTSVEGTYSVRTDAHLTNGPFNGKDHTTGTGNFMIVNGAPAPAGALAWAPIAPLVVQPNTTYYFSAWALTLTNITGKPSSFTAILQFKINGVQSGSIAYLPNGYTVTSGPYTWVRFFGQWNSGPATTADISIVDLSTAAGGNDFGLDDISFGTLSPVSLSALPISNSGASVCSAGSLYLTANAAGGASPYTYTWTGPNSFNITTSAPLVTVTPVATATNNGVYHLTITDGLGCQVAASTTVNVSALPQYQTPKPLTTTLCSGIATSISMQSETGVTYQLRAPLDLSTTVAGTGSTIYLPTGVLDTTTTFQVFATNDSTGCGILMIDSAIVTIASTPVLQITNQAVCSGTVNLTSNSVTAGTTGLGAGSLFYWNNSAATSTLVTPASVGTGTYYIQAVNGACSDIEAVVVSINSNPQPGISYASPFCNTGINPFPSFTGSGVAGIFSFTPAIPGSVLKFVNSSTGQIDLSASTPGTYTIKNTVAPIGCTAGVGTKTITITALPVANFHYSATNDLCQSINVANQSPVFDHTAYAGTFSSTSASSSSGLSYTSLGVINVGASTPGNYVIWNTIAALNGCPAVADTVFLDINPYSNNGMVSAYASNNSICNGSAINLFAVPDSSYLSALFREKFNSGGLGWTKQNTSTGTNLALAAWAIQPDGFLYQSVSIHSNDNSKFYFTNSGANTGGITHVTLTSAVMSTVGYDSLKLDFYQFLKTVSDDNARVEVSTNGTTWTAVATYSSSLGSQAAFLSSAVNLASYIGKATFYIRFKYDATVGGCWAIDNISITGKSKNYSYSWASFPAGFSSAIGNPTGVAPTINTFYVLTSTNSFGCAQPATPVPVTVIPASTLSGVSQPSVGCIGSGATITLNGLVPLSTSNVYYSIAGIQQTPVMGVAADAAGVATFVSSTLSAANNGQSLKIDSLSNGSCTASSPFSLMINVQSTVTWRGINSSDWFDAQNWCGGIPVSSTNIIIPASAINFPVLTGGSGSVRKIRINIGASVTVTGGKLCVSDSIINNGIFNASAGTIEFNGSAPQPVIKGSWFKNNSIGGLIANNINGLAISSVPADFLSILDSLTFGADNITLNTGDNLILGSTVTRTARVADITNRGAYTNTHISGQATVQRYFPALRAWRLVTSPLSNTGSISSNWQNGGINVPGKGTLVTGPAAVPSANGLDISPNNSSSMKYGVSLSPVLNTKTTLLSGNSVSAANIGYFLFVRGDRDPANTNGITSNITTLSSKGNLQTGQQIFAADPFFRAFTLVGNPYASPVNFSMVQRSNVENMFYVWDPKLNSVGGYILVSYSPADSTYSPTPPSPSGQDSIIQSSQAFFIQTNADGAASIEFNESNKTAKNNLGMFRPTGKAINSSQTLRINLYVPNTDNSSTLADGTLAEFYTGGNAAVDIKDPLKFTNTGENVSLMRNTKSLAIERRPLLTVDDTLFIQLSRTTQRSYRWEFIPSRFDPLLTAWLEDSYTGIKTPLNISAKSLYDFVINGEARSAAINRFRIVFKKSGGPLPVTYKSIRAYQQTAGNMVEWSVANEINITRYEVEKSGDGINFVKVNATPATGTNQNSADYKWLDANPLQGNNFYRIGSISPDGKIEYSNIVLVKTVQTTGSGIRIYPNPVTNGIIGAEFKSMLAGVYDVKLINNLGQTIFTKTISHAAGTAMENIQPDFRLVTGIYQLKVTAPDKDISTVKVIVK